MLKNIRFTCTGTPDDAMLKIQLGAIPGITQMDINSKTHAVDVLYDDNRISDTRIAACLSNPNYQLQP